LTVSCTGLELPLAILITRDLRAYSESPAISWGIRRASRSEPGWLTRSSNRTRRTRTTGRQCHLIFQSAPGNGLSIYCHH